jgi:ABC-type uncharacterized transport system substrate-binding protein
MQAVWLFPLFIGAAIALPAAAQKTELPRVMYLSNGDEASAKRFLDRFQSGMREHDQTDGGTYRLEVRYSQRDPSRMPGMIRDAVAARPAAIIVAGLLAARQARDATRTIPIVVATSSDLVDAGLIKSYARPGGNITGLNDLVDELTVKRLEVLNEMLPRAKRVALLVNPEFPATPKIERRVRAAATTLGVEILRLEARDLAGLMAVLDSLGKTAPDALLVGGDALFTNRARELIERASAAQVPVFHYWPGTAEMGALASHQADILQNYQRAAYYVDRILKGAKPGDLPVEQPTRYELVVNRKVAKALQITIPQSVLLRADKVID